MIEIYYKIISITKFFICNLEYPRNSIDRTQLGPDAKLGKKWAPRVFEVIKDRQSVYHHQFE
jgi:hypothetical protein